jgi:hypothetical protein
MTDVPNLSMWNVTFVGDHFWVGATVPGTSELMAENVARDQIHLESGIPWEIISTLPHVEVEQLQEAQ